jgi:hypothetical protein
MRYSENSPMRDGQHCAVTSAELRAYGALDEAVHVCVDAARGLVQKHDA